MTRKKRIWIVAVVIILALALMTVIYSCGRTEENGVSNPKDKQEQTDKTQEDEKPVETEAEDVEEHKRPETVKADEQTSDKKEKTTRENKTEDTKKHTHTWLEKKTTVNHEAEGHYEDKLVKEAWVEEVPVFEEQAREICGNCGADVTSNPGEHIMEHMLNGTGQYGCRTEYRQIQVGTKPVKHPAEYQKVWVEDKAAYQETVITYYCECGAKK